MTAWVDFPVVNGSGTAAQHAAAMPAAEEPGAVGRVRWPCVEVSALLSVWLHVQNRTYPNNVPGATTPHLQLLACTFLSNPTQGMVNCTLREGPVRCAESSV